MNRLAAIIVLLLIHICGEIGFSQDTDSLMNRIQAITIEEILALPEEQIDVGLADLVLAKDFYPDLKIESFLHAFDYMADRFMYFFGQHTDPDKRVRALNSFLYQKGEWNDSITFGYDDEDLHARRLSNKFINGYIATKKGSCITLPMMYVILAGRLGFPIYAARLPYHFFVRYVPEPTTPSFQENIEATNGGSYVPNEEYKKTFRIPEKALKNGVYLRTLTKKQYVASLLLINANEWIARKNLDRAKHYLELLMKYDSTFTSATMNYATVHLQEALLLEQQMNEEKRREMAFHDICARNEARDQTSHQLPSPLQGKFRIPESGLSAFEVPIESIVSKMKTSKQNQPAPQWIPPSQFSVKPELQMSLGEITQRYAPLIQEKLDVYESFKQKAEGLGIVRAYPLTFFRIQSKSLEQFQEKGVK